MNLYPPGSTQKLDPPPDPTLSYITSQHRNLVGTGVATVKSVRGVATARWCSAHCLGHGQKKQCRISRRRILLGIRFGRSSPAPPACRPPCRRPLLPQNRSCCCSAACHVTSGIAGMAPKKGNGPLCKEGAGHEETRFINKISSTSSSRLAAGPPLARRGRSDGKWAAYCPSRTRVSRVRSMEESRSDPTWASFRACMIWSLRTEKAARVSDKAGWQRGWGRGGEASLVSLSLPVPHSHDEYTAHPWVEGFAE